MKYISEFRDQRLVKVVIDRIKQLAEDIGREVRLMEVCGTHAMAILRFGIREIIPPNVKLISGPGCPVCVTPNQYIDIACGYARKGFLVLTFGDMMKVPGSESSLLEEKSKGRKVKIVYSPLDALKLAKSHPEEKVVFLGIGFETTAPTVAVSVSMAKKEQVNNFMVLCGHKLIPPAMKALLKADEVKIDGFLCPGHVSVIIGSNSYEFLARDYSVPCVVAGFEPLDILQGINLLLSQICCGEARVENEYKRAVAPEGNLEAQRLMRDVFEVCDSEWRGLGTIEDSGFCLAEDYAPYDVQTRFPIKIDLIKEKTECRCGEVLRGLIEPEDCSLFGDPCNPSNPFGPCMVSVEGACNIHYRFRERVKSY